MQCGEAGWPGRHGVQGLLRGGGVQQGAQSQEACHATVACTSQFRIKFLIIAV